MSRDAVKRELKILMPNGDLRLVRDPHRLGLDLWVIERRIPPEEHQRGLEQLRQAGEERFHPLAVPDIGLVQYDCAPEWHMVHICKASTCRHVPPQFSVHDPQCYREPNATDIAVLRQWLFEFRNAEESIRELQRETAVKQEAAKAALNLGIRKDIKSSKPLRGLVYSFPGDGVTSTTERINGKR